MRLIVYLLIAFALFPVFIDAQLKQEIGLSSSWRGFDTPKEAINLSAEYRVCISKFISSVNLGSECWYINYSNVSSPLGKLKPSFTGKVEPWIGFETNLFHSGVFISANVGTRFYFLNQLKDSLSLFERYDNHFILGVYSRKHIQNMPNYLAEDPNYPMKAAENYVTKMPITFLTRVNIGYAFKRLKISAFVMPYWVRFHYQNAAFPERKGKTFLFFYDIGLGINYTLPFKKKETKTSGDGE